MKTSPSNLPLPPLGKADITDIKALHQSWSIYVRRMAQLTPDCVLAGQKAALQAFLATPSQENERNRHRNDHGIEVGTGCVVQQGCPTLWTTNSRF